MKMIKGPYKCPICEDKYELRVKKPGPFVDVITFLRCKTCECKYRIRFKWKGKKGVEITDHLLELSNEGLSVIMQDAELYKRIKSPFLAREILSRFRVGGESIGYLVPKSSGKEIPLEEASDEECMKAAYAVIQSQENEDENSTLSSGPPTAL